MTITDKKAVAILKRIADEELYESVDAYPEAERDERTDMEFIADEISYYVSCYNEDGHDWKDDLDEAKELLRETNRGKFIPLDPRTMKPKHGYWPSDIESAKYRIATYRRFVNALRGLQKAGFYGRWYTV